MIKETKGSKIDRIDGPAKVTGTAQYTSDHNFPDMAYAVPVCAKIGKGKLKSLNVSEATKVKGVIGVFSRENIGPLYRPTLEAGFDFRTDEPRPPFEDDNIYYYNQYIAVVVAETFEIAQRAARAVKATYNAEKPNLDPNYKQEKLFKVDTERGNAKATFAKAPVKVDHTYTTPIEVHSPIELHSTVAVWEDDEHVTIYETSQAVVSHRNVVAQVLGLPSENVRVITKYLGSGFGGKLWMWPHSPLAAATARIIKRPVKLVLDRHMAFTNAGHRARTQQKMQIASNEKGELQALIHEYASQSSVISDYKENCGEISGLLYNIPDVYVTSGLAMRNQSCQTSMRGPGAVPGSFALESALDELAIALKMDPVQLRLVNDTQTDLMKKQKFSSRHLRECLELGAKKFGWEKRNPAVGSMRDGDEILGWGMAGCTWHFARMDANATFLFQKNGRVAIHCGTHDIGTGMYTVLAKLVSEETGMPISQVDVHLGDTDLPKGPLAGGSMATGSVVPAVIESVANAVKNLKATAVKVPTSPFFGKKEDDLKFENGKVGGMAVSKLLEKLNMASIQGRAAVKGSAQAKDVDKEKEAFTTRSFGAQFVEMGWNPLLARLRVRRVVTVIDAGRIINYRQARNQIEGGVIMGIGMGIFEEALYDHRDGNMVNNNFADYVMAVHADCPDLQVSFLDYPDKEANAYGARGVGEIGVAGVAAAITNGVYHATGVRVRDLPVTIEKLLSDGRR